jgi:hypothetical protein
MLEASMRQWSVVEDIGVPEVLVFNDMARWTRVMSSFVGLEDNCKSQRTIMTM